MKALINGIQVTLNKKQQEDVEKGWANQPLPVESDVKREAARRILEIAPEWKQRNLLAQAVKLTAKGRSNWTEDELAAWEAGEVIWSTVTAIREASDKIKRMSPIPTDFQEDKRWP
ncbi:hypothetical protein [Ruegeria sp. EL01]|jgi:hypothetical protein|uniref:hypothetical protein n=1 Tax=Ruegeria sp. EL01 TaxID=2107578 RepID=UPI000EA8373A|nr:hypothetical protein [Ruegeria sp. EL01]